MREERYGSTSLLIPSSIAESTPRLCLLMLRASLTNGFRQERDAQASRASRRPWVKQHREGAFVKAQFTQSTNLAHGLAHGHGADSCESESVLPSGSSNQTTFAPPGAVHIPASSWSMPS